MKPTDTPAFAALPGAGMVTCGAHGGRGKDGTPCAQPVFGSRRRCVWHPEALDGDPEAATAHRSAMGRIGSNAAKAPKRLDRKTGDPNYDSPAAIGAWCALMAGKVSRGDYTDYKALDAQLKLARLALDALGVGALNDLADLEALVRGRLNAGAA